MAALKPYISIRKAGKKVFSSAGQIAPQFGPECIHDFRTATKKLRALVHCFSIAGKPLTGSFRKMYHLSGELRNAQVLLKSTERIQERLAGFRGWLQASFIRLTLQWQDSYDPAILRHLCTRLKKGPYKKGKLKEVTRFFQKRILQVRGILCLTPLPDERLHEARKIVRELQSVYEWSVKKRLRADPLQRREVLKRIGQQAGDFNDRRIAVALLSAYLGEERDEAAKQNAVAVRQEWEQLKERQKKELILVLSAFAGKDAFL